jgi:hypothetical protein
MSRTLERLLTGVLTGAQVELRSQERSALDLVEKLLPALPMSLSRRQRQAVLNAWSSDLSYIQGPPGTGKSHTISALMLSALLLGKRVLLTSHKPAAISVVRDKLNATLGDDVAIYVGGETEGRKLTHARIQRLLDEVQSSGIDRRLSDMRERENDVRRQLEATHGRIVRDRAALEAALTRAKAALDALREHEAIRTRYHADYGRDEMLEQALAALPRVGATWESALERVDDIHKKRITGQGEPPAIGEMLFARMVLSRYRQQYRAAWIKDSPWNVRRLHSHHGAISAFDRSRENERHITADISLLRTGLDELHSKKDELAKDYIRTRFRRRQLEYAANSIGDLTDFAKLFRLRSARLIRPKMASVDYANITRVFPIWLGEMRDLGSYLPFTPSLFDLAVVDEASQVNIAEVVPAFYRADSFVVAGDCKQLGLEAAGLFGLNRTFEELAWSRRFGGIKGVVTYRDAQERELAVSTASILDFIVSPANKLSVPQATLDEHFRSMPPLAAFTSREFYLDDGGLKVMTEVGGNHGKACFQGIEVGGTRDPERKFVPQEVSKAIELARDIASGRLLTGQSPLALLGFHPSRVPSVGIISFTTQQREVLQARAEEDLDPAQQTAIKLHIGTPEEFQGNERDVMILTFALGDGGRYAVGFYEKPTRFNVATSRAKAFTYAVIGRCPSYAGLLRRYFGSFGWKPSVAASGAAGSSEIAGSTEPVTGNRLSWRLDEGKCESQFERRVLVCLQDFVDRHPEKRLRLYNQVNACGQKRLDFVVQDEGDGRSVAVEVDGDSHYCSDGRTYSHDHLERIGVLRRAGWKIVHVPYFKWYRHGWLMDKDDATFQRVVDDFYKSLRRALNISGDMASPRRAVFT